MYLLRVRSGLGEDLFVRFATDNRVAVEARVTASEFPHLTLQGTPSLLRSVATRAAPGKKEAVAEAPATSR